jgi:hypothetical protein
MKHTVGLTLGFVLLLSIPQADAGAAEEAGPPGPICRLPTVVEVMRSELRQHAFYLHIDARTIQEAPTTDATVVVCGVCVRVFAYNTTLYGDHPVVACQPHRFSVKAVTNGFVVQSLP